jgi:hypothetical protein
MKPTTKRLLARFDERRKLYPRGKAATGRKFLAKLDNRTRREYGHATARKSLYL